MSSQLSPVRIAITGEFQRGKSLLVNCLLGRRVAAVGDGLRTTPRAIQYHWGAKEKVECRDGDARLIRPGPGTAPGGSLAAFLRVLQAGQLNPEVAEVKVFLPDARLRRVVLIDTPGLDRDNNDTEAARLASLKADLVLYLAGNRQLSDPELQFIRKLADAQLPLVLIFNCTNALGMDARDPKDLNNQKIPRTCFAQLQGHSRYDLEDVRGVGANLFNLSWWAHAENVSPDASADLSRRKLPTEFFDNDQQFAPEKALESSRGEILRQFVFAEPERCLGWNAGCLGILHREIREWQCAGKQLIKTLNQGS